MEYRCTICKLNYKSRSGLWKHNQKNHITPVIPTSYFSHHSVIPTSYFLTTGVIPEEINYSCRK